MTPTKWSSSIFHSFPRLFDDNFTRDLNDWSNSHFSDTNTTLPSVNIRESNEMFLVEMAVPGMKKEDFRIELDNEQLKISSEKQSQNDSQEDSERYTRREFSYQSFQRSFHLPKSVVDTGKINARYENGVLQILIPKREEARAVPPRLIKVA